MRILCFALLLTHLQAAEPLRIAVFNADATPEIGMPVAYVKARSITDPLSARGVVMMGEGKPVVLCAVDWIGIGNGGHDEWRRGLAEAAGTAMDRVTVHTLHQHDGVRCDLTAEELNREARTRRHAHGRGVLPKGDRQHRDGGSRGDEAGEARDASRPRRGEKSRKWPPTGASSVRMAACCLDA